ncbi:MAG: phosphoribosylglycinamide formyltransferase [Deltaproteobacteria bacterium]|jgi:phosphoribosylglycinamide formyltransferase-1|nr:phosphoribosylglycinamide formyltransferase [Deltaproteobacteria bacterium]
MNFAVFCSGRGTNLAALLDAHEAGRIGGAVPVAVVCDSHHAGAINVGRERGIYSTFVPRTAYHANRDGFERRLLEVLAPLDVDFVILAGFMRILGNVFLSAFPNRVINVHPALLPAFPGHDVWRKAIDYGVKLAGATVHFVDEGVDSGPIIIQGTVPVFDGDDADELADRILTVEHKILPQAVKWLAEERITLSGRHVSVKGVDQPTRYNNCIWPPFDFDYLNEHHD